VTRERPRAVSRKPRIGFPNAPQPLATPPVPPADPEPGGARAEGAVPRIGARLLLVVRQSADAAGGLLVRLSVVLKPRTDDSGPYAIFLFCGILPWTWFSSSVLESSNVLISGGNLIKKVLFPAEVLPIVTVLANMVHFLLGLPILFGFMAAYRVAPNLADIWWFPIVILVQLVFTTGIAFIVSALTVHFRDLKDILGNLMTFWFFSTPIIYDMKLFKDWPIGKRLIDLNPFTHSPCRTRRSSTTTGRSATGSGWWRSASHRSPCSCAATSCSTGCVTRSRRRCDDPAIEATNVTKIYRRFAHRRQFATLKSALLRGTVLRDLRPDETFPRSAASRSRSRRDRLRHHRPQRVGQEHDAQDGRGHHQADRGHRRGGRPHLGADRTGCRVPPGDFGPRERLHQRIMLGLTKKEVSRRFDEIVDFAELRDFIDAPVKTYSSACTCGSASPWRSTSTPTSC